MRCVPTAQVNDGLFDVVITRPIPGWAIAILMAIYVPGWYAKTPFVTRKRCRSVRILCPGMTVNLDGARAFTRPAAMRGQFGVRAHCFPKCCRGG